MATKTKQKLADLFRLRYGYKMGERKKANTTLARTAETERVWQLIERAEAWLRTHHYTNEIIKWETEQWGEIKADFGRK